jgi:hypothetical protein
MVNGATPLVGAFNPSAFYAYIQTLVNFYPGGAQSNPHPVQRNGTVPYVNLADQQPSSTGANSPGPATLAGTGLPNIEGLVAGTNIIRL